MKVLRYHPSSPRLSIILLDWNVRESFHTLDYLRRQTLDRSLYEVIWIEFYDAIPGALERKLEAAEQDGQRLLDQWLLVEAGDDVYFHKHFAYNVGIAMAQGELCCVCDSDAMYPETFVERVIGHFEREPASVLHLDQVRSGNRRYYPFNYPEWSAVLNDPLATNWNGRKTQGVDNSPDMLHEANYGACMVARRDDLLAVGGADEHLDYLGYICGPYDMTFRLANLGRREVWFDDLFLVHTWHPSEGGTDNLGGPNDGRGMSLRALEARASGRTAPLVENPVIGRLRADPALPREERLAALAATDFAAWSRSSPHLRRLDPPRLVRENVEGHNIVVYQGIHYAFPQSAGAFLPEKVASGEYAVTLVHDADIEVVVRQVMQRHAAPTVAAAIGSSVPAAGLWTRLRALAQRVMSPT